MPYPSSSPASSASSSSSYTSWSPPASSRRSPVHEASLIDPSRHSPEILQLVDVRLTKGVIEYVVDSVSETLDFAMGRPSSRGRAQYRSPLVEKFTSFVSTVLERAEVTTPTLLVALVYVARARPHLSIALEQWALERIFLGALICAAKYSNDSTLKNAHWALCTNVFGRRDIGRIEREFLAVLDWELGIKEADVLAHHEGLVRAAAAAAVPRRHHRSSHSRPATKPYARPIPVVPTLSLSRGSSPSSGSDTSLSPRTPPLPMMDFEPPPTPTRRRCADAGSGIHDLLYAFPVPRPHRGAVRGFPLHVFT